MTTHLAIAGLALMLGLAACQQKSNPGAAQAAAGGGGEIVFARDAAVGAQYGAPGPRSCAPRDTPQSGALSDAQAAAYVICSNERVLAGAEQLLLMENVQVHEEPGRPFNMSTDAFSGIDPSKPVYEIHGGYTSYLCGKPGNGDEPSPGVNCLTGQRVKAKGACFRVDQNAWACTFEDFDANPGEDKPSPPPAA